MFIAICMCISKLFCTSLADRCVLDVFLYATDKIRTAILLLLFYTGLLFAVAHRTTNVITVEKVSKSLFKLLYSVIHGG